MKIKEDGTFSYASGGGQDSGDIATYQNTIGKENKKKKKKKKLTLTFKEWLMSEGVLERRCLVCGKSMGKKASKGVTGVSHGICPECMKKLGYDYEELKKKYAKNKDRRTTVS